jgi:hypothetical protein
MNPPKQLHYDLFLREADIGIYWKLTDSGITLDAEGMAWNAGGIERRYRYDELRAVRLRMTSGGRSEYVYFCTLYLTDGNIVTIYSGSASGATDAERDPVYGEFVRVLHARLASLKLYQIDFIAGQSEGRYYLILFAGILTIGFAVVLPLALLFLVGTWETLFILLAGIGLAWPMWQLAQSSRPRGYLPEDLPEDLVP